VNTCTKQRDDTAQRVKREEDEANTGRKNRTTHYLKPTENKRNRTSLHTREQTPEKTQAREGNRREARAGIDDIARKVEDARGIERKQRLQSETKQEGETKRKTRGMTRERVALRARTGTDHKTRGNAERDHKNNDAEQRVTQ